jgi:seryl-tRNA synthetase
MTPPPIEELYDTLRNELLNRRLLIDTGVPGLYGRSQLFERIIDGIDHAFTTASADDGAEVLRFPPIINRASFEKVEYIKAFPQLMGIIHTFTGNDKAHRELLRKVEAHEDWTKDLDAAAVVLKPAACYPVYPTMTGTLPAGGKIVDVMSYCFRHEPSPDPARMMMFRMHEHIRFAAPDEVKTWRDLWFARSQRVLAAMGLHCRAEVANDPFFGRTGKVLAQNQRDAELKFELLVTIHTEEAPTAVVSLNYHQDHFAHLFDIRLADGTYAHTSCIGFGMERLAIALLVHHGFDPHTWPAAVKTTLGW